jgi:hypothetical protein
VGAFAQAALGHCLHTPGDAFGEKLLVVRTGLLTEEFHMRQPKLAHGQPPHVVDFRFECAVQIILLPGWR